jgi:hypothetical protein
MGRKIDGAQFWNAALKLYHSVLMVAYLSTNLPTPSISETHRKESIYRETIKNLGENDKSTVMPFLRSHDREKLLATLM